MHRALALLAALLVAGTSATALAQKYPAKPVRVIVPYAPGGGTDILGRVLAKKLSDNTGQSFVVDNRAGGNATIGVALAAKAPADGYTLLIVSGVPYVINQFAFKGLPYDTIEDFEPISQFASVPMVLVSHPSFPAENAGAFVSHLRARPQLVNYAATDEMTYLGMEMITQGTGTRMTPIQYKGAGPALNDLLGGHVSVMLSSISPALPHIREGKVKALAITSRARAPSLPQVPTVTESILPGYELTAWFGMFAPAKTPREVVSALHEEIVKAVRAPEMQEQFAKLGASPNDMAPAEFAAYVRAERERWGKAFRDAGMQAK